MADENNIPNVRPGSATYGDTGFDPPVETREAMDFMAYTAYKSYTDDCKMSKKESAEALGLSEDEIDRLLAYYEGEDDDE